MTTTSPALTHIGSGGRLRGLTIIATLVAALCATNVLAQAPDATGGAAPATSAVELEELVGRIALYPDDLIAIILPAATNPLQLVQADRYLEKRKAGSKLAVDEKWDDAIKSLLNYPEIVKSMSGDLDWTAALGEAVVADQGDVLEAVQAFRRKTHAAGNLRTDAKQVVVVEKDDGLYWPADPARVEETSPFGPLIAESTAYLAGHKTGDACRGYRFRTLTSEGKTAPGGAYSFVINGRMIAGFAMVAYPAAYGVSGVMTFIVSHNGKIYEKDLDNTSTSIGAKLTAFDPGTGWKEVVP